MKTTANYKPDRIEEFGNLYQKLKGTIFLRLAPKWIVGSEENKEMYYPMNVWGEHDYEVCSTGIVIELKKDMTFAQFVQKWS